MKRVIAWAILTLSLLSAAPSNAATTTRSYMSATGAGTSDCYGEYGTPLDDAIIDGVGGVCFMLSGTATRLSVEIRDEVMSRPVRGSYGFYVGDDGTWQTVRVVPFCGSASDIAVPSNATRFRVYFNLKEDAQWSMSTPCDAAVKGTVILETD